MKENVSTELMFVIDNSGSMYPQEMVDGSEENDTQFKRVDLSNRIIDKLKEMNKLTNNNLSIGQKLIINEEKLEEDPNCFFNNKAFLRVFMSFISPDTSDSGCVDDEPDEL